MALSVHCDADYSLYNVARLCILSHRVIMFVFCTECVICHTVIVSLYCCRGCEFCHWCILSHWTITTEEEVWYCSWYTFVAHPGAAGADWGAEQLVALKCATVGLLSWFSRIQKADVGKTSHQVGPGGQVVLWNHNCPALSLCSAAIKRQHLIHSLCEDNREGGGVLGIFFSFFDGFQIPWIFSVFFAATKSLFLWRQIEAHGCNLGMIQAKNV